MRLKRLRSCESIYHQFQIYGDGIEETGRDYGSKVIGEVTLDQVYGGARGIKSLVWEVNRKGHSVFRHRTNVFQGSVLDSEEGIRFRGKTVRQNKGHFHSDTKLKLHADS